MRIFGFNIARSSPPVAKTFDPYADAWLRGDALDSRTPFLANAYEQVVWVYRAINVLAEQIGNIPFLFSSGERGRENLITNGPLVDFYDQPHPQINRFQYWELRLIWLMLRGECFRVPIYQNGPVSSPSPGGEGRGEGGLPNSLSSLKYNQNKTGSSHLLRVLIPDPAHFHHIIEDHQLIGWRYTGFGRETPLASQVFLPEEVWFEKLSNPFNFWRGLGPLRVAALAAQTDFAAGSFMKGVMENNGDLGLVVRMKEQTSPEQREQLKAALRERKRRAGTADNPLLLWNSSEVVQPHLSSGDLQFLENRKFSRSEICAAFGVPEEIVTTTDNSKYDVVSGARLNFIEHRVGPLCRRLEAGEDVTVKKLDPNAVGWFDLDSLPIMQKAQRDRLATARSVFDMGVPFNELNRVLDLGFRRLPWGDRGYIATNLAEVGRDGSAGKRDVGSSSLLHAAERDLDRRDPLRRLSGIFEKLQAQASGEDDLAGEGIPIPIHSVPSGVLPDASPLEVSPDAQLISRFRRFFFEQRGRVLARLANASLPLSAGDAAASFFDLATEKAQLELLKLPDGVNGEAPFRVRHFLSQELIELYGRVSDSLEEGLGLQETREQLAERVRGIYNEVSGRIRNPKSEVRSEERNTDLKKQPQVSFLNER